MVAQRTLTPYVEVRILLPLPKKRQAPTGACFFFTLLYKGFGPAKVSALRKQFSELFLAESARRVLKFGRISVAEAGSMQGVSRSRRSNPFTAAKKETSANRRLFLFFIPSPDAFSTPFPTGLARSPLDGRAMRVTVGAGYAHQIE